MVLPAWVDCHTPRAGQEVGWMNSRPAARSSIWTSSSSGGIMSTVRSVRKASLNSSPRCSMCDLPRWSRSERRNGGQVRLRSHDRG